MIWWSLNNVMVSVGLDLLYSDLSTDPKFNYYLIVYFHTKFYNKLFYNATVSWLLSNFERVLTNCGGKTNQDISCLDFLVFKWTSSILKGRVFNYERDCSDHYFVCCKQYSACFFFKLVFKLCHQSWWHSLLAQTDLLLLTIPKYQWFCSLWFESGFLQPKLQ